MLGSRAVRRIGILVALGLVLGACGNGDEGSGTTEPGAVTSTGAGPSTTNSPSTTEAQQTIEPVTLQLAMPIADVGWPGGAIAQWADEVKTASGGAIDIEIFPASSLLPGPETLPGLADGRADLGFTYNLYHPTDMPLWGVASIPFVTDDGFAVAAAFRDLYEDNTDFQAELQRMGVIPLWFAPVGSSSFGYSEPVTAVEQVQGLRLRAPGLAANIVAAAGADGVFVDGAEFYESMDRGVIDGWTGTEMPGAVFGVNIQEVTPAFTNPGFGPLSSSAVFIGADRWNSLDQSVRDVILEVSAGYPDSLVDFVAESDSGACDLVLEQGDTVTLLPQAEVDKWAGLLGTEIVDMVATTSEEATGMTRAAFDDYYAEYLSAVEAHAGEAGYQEGQALCAARAG